jgi:hypothetical protein
VTGRALPRPLADDGVVHNDTWSRTVTVRPAPHASGRVKLLWRDAVSSPTVDSWNATPEEAPMRNAQVSGLLARCAPFATERD